MWPNKKLISKAHLENGDDSNLLDSLTINCQLDGTYDINVDDWTCTKPCPLPSNPDPTIMVHDWPHNDTKPEIYQVASHSCLDGRHLVTKIAFETGAETNLLDSLMSMCTVTGWMNETIGSYTCSKGCEDPDRYPEVFNDDWTTETGSDIGTEVRYSCLNSRKQVVNIKKEDGDLYDALPVTCLYNGKYDTNIFDFGCTECVRRDDPPNGKISCESKRYASGSSCYLQCDHGYIPIGKTKMTCEFDSKLDDFEWNLDEDQFKCVEPIGLVIGGQDDSLRYSNEVEIIALGFTCQSQFLNPFPLNLIGASAGFSDGESIICGGAIEAYRECSDHKEGNVFCDYNTECVKTLGGAQWCTGPKTDLCYTYEPILSLSWVKLSATLKTARAYGASVVSSDGTFWIFGGVGKKAILKSSERLTFSK